MDEPWDELMGPSSDDLKRMLVDSGNGNGDDRSEASEPSPCRLRRGNSNDDQPIRRSNSAGGVPIPPPATAFSNTMPDRWAQYERDAAREAEGATAAAVALASEKAALRESLMASAEEILHDLDDDDGKMDISASRRNRLRFPPTDDDYYEDEPGAGGGAGGCGGDPDGSSYCASRRGSREGSGRNNGAAAEDDGDRIRQDALKMLEVADDQLHNSTYSVHRTITGGFIAEPRSLGNRRRVPTALQGLSFTSSGKAQRGNGNGTYRDADPYAVTAEEVAATRREDCEYGRTGASGKDEYDDEENVVDIVAMENRASSHRPSNEGNNKNWSSRYSIDHTLLALAGGSLSNSSGGGDPYSDEDRAALCETTTTTGGGTQVFGSGFSFRQKHVFGKQNVTVLHRQQPNLYDDLIHGDGGGGGRTVTPSPPPPPPVGKSWQERIARKRTARRRYALAALAAVLFVVILAASLAGTKKNRSAAAAAAAAGGGGEPPVPEEEDDDAAGDGGFTYDTDEDEPFFSTTTDTRNPPHTLGQSSGGGSETAVVHVEPAEDPTDEYYYYEDDDDDDDEDEYYDDDDEDEDAIYQPPDKNLTFYVTSNVPYSPDEEQQLLGQLSDIANETKFVIHLGNIQDPAVTLCQEEKYRQVAALLKQSPVPVFTVPGEQDWANCPAPDTAWTYWSKNLAMLDLAFGQDDMNLHVFRQQDHMHNFGFERAGVLFMGVHVVNGVVFDWDETARRGAGQYEWIADTVAAVRGRIRAVVLFGNAQPGMPHNQAFFQAVGGLLADLKMVSAYVFANTKESTEADRVYMPFVGIENVIAIEAADGETQPPLKITISPGNSPALTIG